MTRDEALKKIHKERIPDAQHDIQDMGDRFIVHQWATAHTVKTYPYERT